MLLVLQGTYYVMTFSTDIRVIFLLSIIEQISQWKNNILFTFLFPKVTIRDPYNNLVV